MAGSNSTSTREKLLGLVDDIELITKEIFENAIAPKVLQFFCKGPILPERGRHSNYESPLSGRKIWFNFRHHQRKLFHFTP